MKTPLQNLGCVLFVVVCGGCGNTERAPGEVVRRPGQPPMTVFADDDAPMAAAIRQARETVNQFIPVVTNPQPAHSAISVKIRVTDGTNTEHMWLSDVKFDGERFSGLINNEPADVKDVWLGKEVTAARDEISDWMYAEGGKLVGGYTLRVARDKMTPAERSEFDRSLPFVIE